MIRRRAMNQLTLGSRRWLFALLFGLLQLADLTNHHHPLFHLLLGLGSQIVCPMGRYNVENMLKLNTLFLLFEL